MKLLNEIAASRSEFDSAVNQILQRPDYAHLRNSVRDFVDGIREAIAQWLLEMLNKTFSHLSSAPRVSERLSTVFIIAGFLIVFSVLIFIIVKASKAFEKKSRIKVILGEKIDQRTTPGSLRNKAALFVEQSDFRQAVRYDFIALLLLMHEKNLVYLDETKTNEEIGYYLKKNGFSMLDAFRYLSEVFNASWYGHKFYNSEGYEQWSNHVNLIWSKVINDEYKSE